MNKTIAVGWLMVALASSAFGAGGGEKPDPKLLREARLSQARAEKIALRRAPGGKVKSGELEREKGHLVWSFDIGSTTSGNITEVLVDAKSGQIVSVQTETPRDQAAEARADRARK
jgi:hypothetical protein